MHYTFFVLLENDGQQVKKAEMGEENDFLARYLLLLSVDALRTIKINRFMLAGLILNANCFSFAKEEKNRLKITAMCRFWCFHMQKKQLWNFYSPVVFVFLFSSIAPVSICT